MSLLLLVVFALQISAAAIVARVKQNDARIQDLSALARMEIVTPEGTKTRSFRISLKREGVDYRARFRLLEPPSMAGTEFLVDAARGRRNRQWAYFPDLELVREIPGRSQEDPFLGSHITYADLAGGAHLDDLEHRLLGEEEVSGDLCYVLEGVPRRGIEYGKLRGWVRKEDFVTVKAVFFDRDGEPLKEALLSDVRDLGEGVLLPHRIEMRSATEESHTLLTFSEVEVNRGLSAEEFTESALGTR